jgi:hypothetical protein
MNFIRARNFTSQETENLEVVSSALQVLIRQSFPTVDLEGLPSGSCSFVQSLAGQSYLAS